MIYQLDMGNAGALGQEAWLAARCAKVTEDQHQVFPLIANSITQLKELSLSMNLRTI